MRSNAAEQVIEANLPGCSPTVPGVPMATVQFAAVI